LTIVLLVVVDGAVRGPKEGVREMEGVFSWEGWENRRRSWEIGAPQALRGAKALLLRSCFFQTELPG